MVEEILIGRKTFFIAPDFSLIPESYLEEYLELGYECYFVCNDKTLPVEYKVDVILSVFKDSIVFFCIDTVIHGVNWEKIIFRMQKKYGDKARLGVIYNKRKTDAERHAHRLRRRHGHPDRPARPSGRRPWCARDGGSGRRQGRRPRERGIKSGIETAKKAPGGSPALYFCVLPPKKRLQRTPVGWRHVPRPTTI